MYEANVLCELVQGGIKCGTVVFHDAPTLILSFVYGAAFGVWLVLVVYAIVKLLDKYDIKIELTGEVNEQKKSTKKGKK